MTLIGLKIKSGYGVLVTYPKPYGVTSLFKYWVCRVFGHKIQEVGEPIIHHSQGLIEQDGNCLRCGMKGTSVLPYNFQTEQIVLLESDAG